MIRKAETKDLSRIAEIFVFNNRVNYYPIFKDKQFSFGELQVVSLINNYFAKEEILHNLYVFDDGLVKGFIEMKENEICKVYVDSFFQNCGVGKQLIKYATNELSGKHLWALEKNTRAIAFYKKHGFIITKEKVLEKGTEEYLIKLEKR